jgi:protein-tyrosine phosphatase
LRLSGKSPYKYSCFSRRVPFAVYDLHSHVLPGIDDGATDLAVSIAMARQAAESGVKVLACTPHIMPGVYNNTGPQIRQAVAALQTELDREGIALKLVTGADVHLVPDLVAGLKSGRLLSLADTRYVLVEPPHHVAPARTDDMFFSVMVAGYHPILTHPERLGWIRQQYPMIRQLADRGVWMQITASSLTGAFGREPKYWAERMLDEGRVHILASDTHDTRRRPPNLVEGFEQAAKRVGETEALHLVVTRPLSVLANHAPASVPAPAASAANPETINEIRANGASRPIPRAPGGAGQGHRSGRVGWIGRLRRLVGRGR